jgi:hypothetical protein
MTNHYHLLIETPDGNLSIGMRQLKGTLRVRSCGLTFAIFSAILLPCPAPSASNTPAQCIM